ncbi:MAG: hypothetical protein U9P72_03485 [Campylobacterota bacterium]|nr:hypothetical protein [Campylobacterota bacterium]
MKTDEVKQEYKTSFNEVWNQVKSDKLEKLPQDEISYFKLYSDGEDIISYDAQRTLNDHRDIIEPFDKLAHPNGICFKGIWEIDSPNIYSGYFKKGSQALMIARASTAMSHTTSDSTRAFGFAGKLFPTTDMEKQNSEHSANFFLIDDLGGTDAKYYRDVALTNEPSVSFTYEVFKNMAYAVKVSHAFSQADKNPTIRQLYEISYLGEEKNKNIITPKWMKIEAEDTKRVDAKDFRDELRIKEGENLVFNIFVANKIINEKKEWQKIGTITLDDSLISQSCDHRLHFHHPKWRDDLDYGDN